MSAAEGDGPELYPARCSQCGQRWIDRACGPTHAVIAERFGVTDLRLAVTGLYEAVTVEGRSPAYHREQVRRLGREWPVLARAINMLLAEAGDPLPVPVRQPARREMRDGRYLN